MMPTQTCLSKDTSCNLKEQVYVATSRFVTSRVTPVTGMSEHSISTASVFCPTNKLSPPSPVRSDRNSVTTESWNKQN